MKGSRKRKNKTKQNEHNVRLLLLSALKLIVRASVFCGRQATGLVAVATMETDRRSFLRGV